MANTKISALTSGNPAQSGDLIPIDRAGSNFSITGGSLATLATSGLAAIATSGAWSDLQNAAAALTLSNGGNATTFNHTSAVNWTIANTTPAVHLTSQSSPIMVLGGTVFNGASSVADTWGLQVVVGNTDNGTSALTLSHAGTTGALSVSVPCPFVWSTYSGTVPATNVCYVYASNVNNLVYNAPNANYGHIFTKSGSAMFGIGGALGGVGVAVGATGIATYNSISTVSNGVPAEYATVDLTAQSAAVAATTLYAVPATGGAMYRISIYLKVTTAATSSSTLGAVTITFTDNTDSVAQSFVPSLSDQAGTASITNTGNLTTSALQGQMIIWAKASTNIQYAIAYTSSGATAMQYEAHLKLERL